MTYSTYLRTAAARASIQIAPAPCMVGSLAEYKASDYVFSRKQSDNIPLEKSPGLEPLWHSWLAGALTFLAIAIVLVIL